MRILAIFPLFLLLGGCAGSVLGDAIAGADAVAAREDAYCQSIGLQFGTADYANCRMSTGQQRQQNHQAAINGAITNMNNTVNASRPVQMAPRTCNSMVNGNMVTTNCY